MQPTCQATCFNKFLQGNSFFSTFTPTSDYDQISGKGFETSLTIHVHPFLKCHLYLGGISWSVNRTSLLDHVLYQCCCSTKKTNFGEIML